MNQVECSLTPRAGDLPTFQVGRPPTGGQAQPMPLPGRLPEVRRPPMSLVGHLREVRFRSRPTARFGRRTALLTRLRGSIPGERSLRHGRPTTPRLDPPIPTHGRSRARLPRRPRTLPPDLGAHARTRHPRPRHPGLLPTTPKAARLALRSTLASRRAPVAGSCRPRVSPPDPSNRTASTTVKPARRSGRASPGQVAGRRTSVRPVTTAATPARRCRPSTFPRWAPDSTASRSFARARRVSLIGSPAHCQVNTGTPPRQ